jgi:thymidine kinase
MKGHLEVICGPMFAGKSEELIRRIKRAEIAKQKVVVFKPSIDNRYSTTEVVSHSGIKTKALSVSEVGLISGLAYDIGGELYDVVAIDEIQFFDIRILNIVEKLINRGARVIVSGLDQDFRGLGFGIMPELLARARQVDKLTAICQVCGEEADMTQRLVDGKPASYGSPTVIVGADEQYEARCRNCHERG